MPCAGAWHSTGMSSFLIHGYFAIGLEEVCVTVERRVPILIEMILREDASTGPGIVSERQAAYRLALDVEIVAYH